MFYDGWHTYYIYILTNKNKTVLYTGVTNNLHRRLIEHSDGIQQRRNSFTARYQCNNLIYYEEYTWIQQAIAREKEIKGWIREKKEKLITDFNPDWDFLNDQFT